MAMTPRLRYTSLNTPGLNMNKVLRPDMPAHIKATTFSSWTQSTSTSPTQRTSAPKRCTCAIGASLPWPGLAPHE
eukprot:2979757-Prorocentrum_lima.AAC.1